MGIRFETVHVRRDGTTFPVEVSSRAFEVAGVRYLHSLVRDLTEPRRAEAALRESEERLARVLEASQDGFFDLDLTSGVSTRSDRVARMLGREPQAIPPTLEGFFALLHGEDLPDFQGEVASVLAGQRPAVVRDVRASHADGSWRWLRVRARLTGPAGARRYTGAITDVTEEREALARAEALAREQEVLLRTATVGISRVVDRRQVWVNQRMAAMLGYAVEEQVGRSTRMLYPSDEAYEALGRTAYPVLAAGQAYQAEQELVRKDGSRLWARYNGMAVDPGDMSKGTIWVLEDVTELRRGQEALAASEARYRSLFEHLREDVTVYEVERDASGRVVDWILRASNAEARRFFGEAHQAVVGRRLTEIAGEAQMRPIIDRTEAILAGDVRTEEILVGLTGRHYLATAFPIDQRTIVTAALDITERVKTEAALRESLAANEHMVAELRDALDHVKTLKGLLPICMHCHKIRDDRGYWARLEKYIGDRTSASFSHGLCPDCAVKHYPDLIDD